MRKKNRVTRMISGLLSAVMVLAAAASPMTAFASELTPEEELKAYVEALPELETVKDQLDPEEIVTAKDYEVEFDADIDLRKDFTNLEIPDREKVKVTFYEAKNTDREDFSTGRAGTYQAVYYVEPYQTEHPAYRIKRNVTVKEPASQAQSEAQITGEGGDAGESEGSEDAEADPEPQPVMVSEADASGTEAYVKMEEAPVIYEFSEEAYALEMEAAAETAQSMENTEQETQAVETEAAEGESSEAAEMETAGGTADPTDTGMAADTQISGESETTEEISASEEAEMPAEETEPGTEAETEEPGTEEQDGFQVNITEGQELGIELSHADGIYEPGETVSFSTDLPAGTLTAVAALKEEANETVNTADLLYSEVTYNASNDLFSFEMPAENIALEVRKDAALGTMMLAAAASGEDSWDDATEIEANKYYYYSDGTLHPFNSVMGSGGNDSYKYVRYKVGGKTYTVNAYCMQHSMSSPPSGTTYTNMIDLEEGGDDKYLRKALFYGYGGPGWGDTFNGYNIQSIMTKYGCTSETRAMQHYLVDYLYDGESGFGGSLSDTAKNMLKEIKAALKAMPDPSAIQLKPALSTTANGLETETFTWKANEAFVLTIHLEDGVSLVNETTGKTGTGNVKVKGGEKFHLAAQAGKTGSLKGVYNITCNYPMNFHGMLLKLQNSQDIGFGYYTDGDDIQLTVSWPDRARVEIIKEDGTTHAKLAGAVYGIYSDADCKNLIVKMPATDSKGASAAEFDAAGSKVYLKELTAPKQYKVSASATGVSVSAGSTSKVTLSDEAVKGGLTVYKEGQVLTGASSNADGTTFQYEMKRLAGASYSVTAGADITAADGSVVYKKGDAVATLKTDANGEASLDNLPLGSYVITETGAPENYINKGESKTVTLTEGSSSAEAAVGTVTFANERQKVEVTALKLDKLTSAAVAGAVFGLYADGDITDNTGNVIVKKDTLVGKAATGTDGKGKFSADLPNGFAFYVKELTAPAGYMLNGSEIYRFTTTYTNDKEAAIAFSHTFEDEEILGKLTIFKEGEVLAGADVTDEGTTFRYEVRKQKGASFAVYAGAEIKSAGGKVIYKKGDLIKDGLVTGDDGSVSLDNLFLGTYTVKETGAPENFVLNGESKDVTLSQASPSGEAVLGSVTIRNDRQKAKVTVIKQDDTTKNPLSGGVYGMYAGADIKSADGKVVVAKDTLIEKATTGTDGSALFKADLPLNNSWYVKEVQAPKNYYRNQNDVYPFTFSYTNEKQVEAAFSHTFENERVNARIDLSKVDAETGEPQGDAKLVKATYGLYAREDIVHPDGKTGVLYKAGAQVAVLTTDDDGKAFIEDLYLGKYFIKELIPSEGYLLDDKEYDLDCAYEGDLVKTVKKTATSKEQVIKQPFQVIKAANNGKTDADLLKGAGFSAYLISSLETKKDGSYDFSKAKPIVLTADGGTEMFTDEKGYAVSIPIPYGKYIVRETTTPHNYTPVDDFKVTISENHPKEPQQWRVLLDDEFEAKLKIIKKDDETKKPVLLPKTEFKVYDLDHQKYVEQVTTYPSVVTHKSYFTDENGYLILPNNLKIGNYRIEEVTAPYGYVLNHNLFEIQVDSNTAYQMDQTSGDAIIEVMVENQPVKGKLTIKKAGEVLASFEKDFGYEMASLTDAEFAVYAAEDIYTPDYQKDENGNRIVIYAKDALVASLTTDAKGTAVVEDLPLGTYRIEETKAPYGFVLNTKPQTVTFAYADQETPVVKQTAEFTNDRQKVEIAVEKQDAETGKKLEGAVFGLYAASAIASADHEKVLVEADTLLEEVTSDTNGQAAFTLDLPLGQYYVKEHKAPAGYVSSDEILTFDAGYQGQDVPVVQLTAVKKNEPTTFEFTKSDITTGAELEGAVLTILTHKGDVIERWTSVKNEPHQVKCLTAGESYVLREEFAPYGYLRATDVVFTVEDTAEIQKVEMKDEVPTALLIINKKGEFLDKVSLLDNAKGTVEHMFEYISGNLTPVTFEIYAAEDIKAADGIAPDYYKNDDLVGTITTDDAGIAKLGDLPVGKYYVVEKETAYGYVLDNAPRYVDLSYRDQDTPIVVYDEKWQNARQKVSVHLVKKEKGTEAPLKGAIFGLYTAEDIKSKDGKVLIEKDTLIEQKTTDADGQISFIADLPIDGKYYLTELLAPNGYVNAGEKQEFTFTYEGSDKDLLSYSFTFVNEPTTVELSKTDITDGKELPGAHLRVIDENASLIDEWVSTETPHIIQKLVVGREYELIETKPADGYVTAESVVFKIENTGEVQKVKMEDDVTKVRLSKSDITTGEELPGAKLTILNEEGKTVDTWISAEEPHYIEKLPIGRYTLREETAPAGYLVAEDVLFTVKDTGIEQKVEMKDDYTKVQISKQDITTGEEIPGAKLTIFDKDGKEVETWVSEEKPHYIEKLPVGEYTLREETAPDGYLRAEDVAFSVKETGEIQTVVMKDDYTKVEISKQDITNSKELPGAKLTILDKDGKEVETWVSEEKPHYIEKLPVGEYTLREVTAPDGYEVAEDVKFTVAETGEIQTVVMKDAPKKQPETPVTENPTNPGTPTAESPKETPTTPKTGDDRNPLLWLLLLGIGGTMLAGALYLRKKGNNDQHHA